MAKPEPDMTESPPMVALRKCAMRLPEAEEGTSCVNRAFRAGKKAYAYLGMKPDHYRLMVKLGDSTAQAEAMQAKHPDHYSVGKNGWTTVKLPHTKKPPAGLLEGWIEESYRLLVPKALVDSLPAGGRKRASPAKKKAVKKKAAPAKRSR